MKTTFQSLLIALMAFLVAACAKPVALQKQESGIDYYTCSMHPSVHSAEPGKCPICSMDLIPVMKKSAIPEPMGAAASGHSASMPETFVVPFERQQRIGVTYGTVERKALEVETRAVGTIEADKARHWEFVARVEGYISKLFVSSPGQQVKKGDPLMTIYSPDLLATEQELLNLLAARDRASSDAGRQSAQRLLDSAERRLELWNVSSEEIAELKRTEKASELLTLRSPFDGIVEAVPVDQGRNVKIGDHLVDVLDLSSVWLWAEFYENEVAELSVGATVEITIPGSSEGSFRGRIAAIDPTLDAMKRTVRARIDVENPEGKLRPGMYADVALQGRAGDVLSVPASAVMPTGTRWLTFLNRGEGRLEPRFVELGRKFRVPGSKGNQARYEVIGGLEEGDRVVTSANFLIDAESKLQGALSMWETAETESTDKAAR